MGLSFGNATIEPAAALAALHVAARRSGSSPGAVPDSAASMNRLFEFPEVSDVSRLSFLEVYKGLPELFGWTVCHGESPTPLEAQWEEVKAEFDQFITDDPEKVREHLVESLSSAMGAVWTEEMDAPIFPGAPRPLIDRGVIAHAVDHHVAGRAAPRLPSLVQRQIGYWESKSKSKLDGAVPST